jgi:hypothetical protein
VTREAPEKRDAVLERLDDKAMLDSLRPSMPQCFNEGFGVVEDSGWKIPAGGQVDLNRSKWPLVGPASLLVERAASKSSC